MTAKRAIAFPFRISAQGGTATAEGDEILRDRIVQLLLTAPGDRVQLADFGCGLRDLLFDPNNEILAATTEYAIATALQRWLGAELVLENVDVQPNDGALNVSITYIRKDDLVRDNIVITL